MEVAGPRLSLSPIVTVTRETSVKSQRPPRRNLSTRTERNPKTGMLRDVRDRRSPPRPMDRVVEKGAKAAARLSPVNKSKPILPATERRPGGDEARPMTKREAEPGKWDIAPDGGSAGREGRQFTVANVGNNGKIFLRPTVRPANQRYPQPTFVFPSSSLTPPSTADLEVAPELNRQSSSILSNQPTPLSGPPSPPITRHPMGLRNLDKQAHHRRAVSDTTLPEVSQSREDEAGGFKVVITKPQDEQRARTTEDIEEPLPSPMLQISIPSWKLGTPRFTLRGTPLIRGSSYAPTEEIRSDHISFANKSHRGDPDRDDRSIVRYASATGSVTAATPPRLVSEITSPCFLDYELLSDFFLTFRSFMEATDLLRMLIARLKWALARADEIGMVVRVRTFVAIRHWILNYFVDDFVVDYHLRITFCNLLNDFVDELSHEAPGRKVQLKILAELKKCWRRVCAQYWDGPDFDSTADVESPINPGGIAGHRNPDLDPSFWMMDVSMPPQISSMDFAHPEAGADTNYYNNAIHSGHIDSVLHGGIHPGERPCTPPDQRPSITLERNAASPTSIASLDVVSCSFPTKGFRMPDSSSSYALAAHPVEPKKVLYKNAEFLLTLPYAGSLVRGNLMPPGQAFVDIHTVKSATSRETTVFDPPQPPQSSPDKGSASAMSGAGMRKLLTSVRKALSHKAPVSPGATPAQGSFISLATIGPRGVTENRIPGTAVVPQARLTRIGGFRPAVRIDMLGAEIAEDFRKAVREDSAAGNSNEYLTDDFPTKLSADGIEYSAAHLDSSFELQPASRTRILSDTAITEGSKSIVIVDGTVPEDHHAMTGALGPLHNESVEAFSEHYMPSGADPTPPTTPPDKAAEGNPRRSSTILSPQVFSFSFDEEPLPPFVPDLATLGAGRRSSMGTDTGSRAHGRRSIDMDAATQSATSSLLPPLSSFRGHKRQQSSRSYRSRGSIIHRRWASSNSVYPQSTVKSFDATTVYTEDSGPAESVPSMPPPLRVLRRRPGGDLRGVQNVADLDVPMHRSRSVGSLTTYSESMRSSYIRSPVTDSGGFVDVVSSDFSQRRVDVFSLGVMAEKPRKPKESLFSTHSSKPVMRPSFEAEAKKLAEIPDDDGDCGVESALAKLEGKYEKRPSRLIIHPRTFAASAVGEVSPETPVSNESSVDHFTPEKRRNRRQHVDVVADDGVSMLSEPMDEAQVGPRTILEVPRSDARSFLSDGSRESYNSVPLLHRGLTDDEQSKTTIQEWANHSILQDSGDDLTPRDEKPQTSFPENLSYEMVEKTKSMEEIKQKDDARDSGEQSFLHVGDEDSDLSSELSFDNSETDEFGVKPMQQSPQYQGMDKADSHSIAHSLATSDGGLQSTVNLCQPLSPEAANVPELHDHQLWPSKQMPPTPDITPTSAQHQRHLDSFDDAVAGTHLPMRNLSASENRTTGKYAAHLPFILAFSSDILAQQFTLIEKDALNEVDWKELVDMRWKNTHTDSRSWVDFLRNSDARGVEVVVARFNIMVKWVVSETVLTQDLEERARCLIKYIHIAAHCRKYRNFATMSQIAVALTSNEVARLSKTWALVPASDMKTMQELESLISPTKNFYNLRAEMEGGATTAETGCIPFVGIYTHDLLFNSQRPSEIASSPTTAPLVNFERCRIAASVVKTLLRLLEASTLYEFQPIEGITERCLWMSALTDDEIRKHSQIIEPSLA
ncbi:Guanine nucleotide exchange factor LTE1 [Apiospora kogelbergensis]|uniref:Guanine nucleotide exchange factor LTE1 n=1 Tax=Apiospora kogelbergensis TaxID=1337665 RepID=A0AAW0R950_9PEZI